MLASLMLVTNTAIAIATPGVSDEGCPSPRQVTEAVQARLPGAVLAPGQPAGSGTLRLGVTGAPGGGVRVQLTDAGGEPVLTRALPPPGRGHAADCPALAETVALIVDRYLHDIGYEAPPLPPPAPAAPAAARTPPPPSAAPAPAHVAWQVGLAFDGRLGDEGEREGAGALALAAQWPSGRVPAGVRLSAGLAPAASARWANDQASLRRIPLRVSGYLTFPFGPGRIEPGLEGGVDLLVVSVTGAQQSGAGTRAAPLGDLALAYALPLARHVYLRAAARGGMAVPYDFVPTNGAGPVWSTPRTYLELGVESGVSF